MLIDFHVHTFLDKLAAGAVASLAARAHFQPFTDGTVAATDELMREGGVDRYVALNIAVSPRTERHVNDYAISLLGGDGHIVPFGSVHPDSPQALAEIGRLAAAGVKGVKFHNEYQGFFVDDEKAFPLYEACAARGMIMLFHGGADRGFSPPQSIEEGRKVIKTAPSRMRRVAERFPQASIVVAHLGGQDMLADSVRFLADTSVYIDTSFASRTVDPKDGAAVIRAFGADRVLFGTDCPWDTPQSTLAWVESLGLSEEEKQKIYFRNAQRLLGA